MYAGFKNKKGLTGGDVTKGSGTHREQCLAMELE